MTFINPYVLWGSLAIAIPLLIHFWHQKRGTVIEWAATQWLIEKNQQQQRGFKFDNLLLLLLRALLVLLLVVLLARPVIDRRQTGEDVQPVHLIQPDARLVDAYRFELETALKKGAKLYWAIANPEPLTTLALPRRTAEFTALGLQSAIDRLPKNDALLNLYVLNSQRLAEVPYVYVPSRFAVHTLADSTPGQRRFLSSAQTRVFVGPANRLTSGPSLPPAVRFATGPAHEGPLMVLLQFSDNTERQTVRAALSALTDVYKVALTVADAPVKDQQYDIMLTDRAPAEPTQKTLYIVSGDARPSPAPNVILASDSFGARSERVVSGQLPEWLGEQLVTYFGLNPVSSLLSQQQLNALFAPAGPSAATPAANESSPALQGGLLLAFIVLIGVERWLALTKNA